MHTTEFTKNELKLIELLKTKECGISDIHKAGLTIRPEFLLKCEIHGVLIYESDSEWGVKGKRYGING